MKKLITLTATSLLLLSTSVSAKALSSEVNLGGGTVTATNTLGLPLSEKLVANANYDITCKIHDANNDNNKVILMYTMSNISNPAPHAIEINGQLVNGPQAPLTAVDNTVVIHNVTSYDNDLNITNVDQTDTVTVSNCIAIAQQ